MRKRKSESKKFAPDKFMSGSGETEERRKKGREEERGRKRCLKREGFEYLMLQVSCTCITQTIRRKSAKEREIEKRERIEGETRIFNKNQIPLS